MEKRICRLPEEALDAIGVKHGGRIVVQGLVPDRRSGYTWKRLSLKVLTANNHIIRERQKAAEPRFSAYYPDSSFLLGVVRDMYPLFIDELAKSVIGAENCSAVRVRRDIGSAISEETVPLMIVAFGGLISLIPAFKATTLFGVIPAVVVSIGLVAAGLALILWNVKSRVP